jgi:hypothetical protein
MTGKVEYKRSGKKLLKVITVEVNEKRIKSKITRLTNELKHAEQQIVAWTKTKDALKAEIFTLDKAYNSSPETVQFD